MVPDGVLHRVHRVIQEANCQQGTGEAEVVPSPVAVAEEICMLIVGLEAPTGYYGVQIRIWE